MPISDTMKWPWHDLNRLRLISSYREYAILSRSDSRIRDCPFVLATHAELDIVLLAWLEVGVVPRKADTKDNHHGKKIVEVEGPLMG
jgi:hypothetical protein